MSRFPGDAGSTPLSPEEPSKLCSKWAVLGVIFVTLIIAGTVFFISESPSSLNTPKVFHQPGAQRSRGKDRPTSRPGPGSPSLSRGKSALPVLNRGHGTSVFMADTHPLVPDIDAPYSSLAAVINWRYARRHGYDFTYYVLNASYAPEPGVETVEDRAVACRHPITGARRAPSWCKLLAAWREASRPTPPVSTDACPEEKTNRGACSPLQQETDRALGLFLDSDCIVSDQTLGIATFVDSSSRQKLAARSPSKPAATVGVFTHHWTPEQLPNAGVFWFRVGPAAAAFFQAWWDSNDPSHDRAHPWEQPSLERLLSPGVGPYAQSVALSSDPTMFHSDGQWIRHFTRLDSNSRLPRLHEKLAELGLNSADAFRSAVEEIIMGGHVVSLPEDAVASAMASNRVAQKTQSLAAVRKPTPSLSPARAQRNRKGGGDAARARGQHNA